MTRPIYTDGDSRTGVTNRPDHLRLHVTNAEVNPCLTEQRQATSCRPSLRSSLRKNDFASMRLVKAATARLHRETVEDLIQDLKSRQVQAVLVSVSCASKHPSRVASLVREFPRIPAVALLSEFELENATRRPRAGSVWNPTPRRRSASCRLARASRCSHGRHGRFRTARSPQPARRRPHRCSSRLLAVFRDDLHLLAARWKCSPALQAPGRHAEHADEPVLSSRSTDAETISRDGKTRSCCSPLRELRLLHRERRQPSRLQLATELRATCAHACCTSQPANFARATTVPACSLDFAPI